MDVRSQQLAEAVEGNLPAEGEGVWEVVPKALAEGPWIMGAANGRSQQSHS